MDLNTSKKNREEISQQDLHPFWNNTVIQLIKEFSTQNPQSAALKKDNTTLSFEEFEKRSDDLALYLIENGIQPEEKVVTIFHPSFELVISIYAILKAGGVYVPVNPKDGEERLRFIIDDLECQQILGTRKTLLKVVGLTNSTLIEVTENGPKPLFNSKKVVTKSIKVPIITPNNLAFIIYTSGTTGRPKGVMVEHRNLFSFIKIMRKTIDVSYGDRWLQNPNIHFDLAVGTIFLSLCNGATLVLETGDLHELIETHNITHYMGTPSTASLVDPSKLPHLKVMAVAGEKSPDELIARYAPFGNLYVGYGPAETTIVCTLNQSNQWKKQNLGTVFEGSQYYVVKPDGTLADFGEAGELWISGDLVARGYLNRPELTREKFIENPFGEGRLYKSGDRVRWVEPGFMEFVGRVDRQVKIRGNRVELDGLELLINGFDGIKGTHAKVLNDNLVAYVVTETPKKQELLFYLKKVLPPYAIPDKIVFLKTFPLTRSGKIDSSAFPNPFENLKRTGILPQTKDQKELAVLWKSVLPKIDTIYLEDNFFDLGGNSLHVLQLIKKIRTQYGNPKITNEIIFKYPVLKDLVNGIENWSTGKIEEFEKVNVLSYLKVLPTTVYFSMGFIFPFIAFSVLSFKFPWLWAYAVLEYIVFGRLIGPIAIPSIRKISFNPIFHKIGFKKIEIIEDVPLGKVEGSIIAVHPHGINDLQFFPLASYLYKNGVKFRATFEKNTFSLPFNRTIYGIAGYIPALLKSYESCKKKGESILVTPGELNEMLIAYRPATIILKSNLNFFQVALKTGMPLIPCMTYNLNKSYKFYPELTSFAKKLPIAPDFIPILPFRGRWGLPIPFRRDYKLVIGKKIEVKQNKNPTWDEIVALRDRYQEELLRIFYKYRPNHYPDLEII